MNALTPKEIRQIIDGRTILYSKGDISATGRSDDGDIKI
jgi:hypothetical protein